MLTFIVLLNQGFDTLVHHLRKYVMQFCSKKPGKVLRALIFELDFSCAWNQFNNT